MTSHRKFLQALLFGLVALAATFPSLALADPLTVTFPSLDASAATEPIGVVDGQLGSPQNPDDIGVYQLPGNLLMVGHVDWAGRLRLFSRLRSFVGGEPIVLSDGRSYHVTWTERFNVDDDQGEWAQAVAPADDVLTLVTCDGPFSQARHLYLERVVVRAERDP